MQLTKFKTKAFFTFSVYLFVWRHQVATWLRDEYGAPLDPQHEVLSMFIPIYSWIAWWNFLHVVQATQREAGVTTTLSPKRAFWWSSLWFNAGPYMNRQLNALRTYSSGKAAGQQTPAASPPVDDPGIVAA